MQGAIDLCNLILKEWPVRTELAPCYLLLAEAYAVLGDTAKAIDYFEKCIQQEKIFPNVRTTVVTTYPEFIVRNKLTHLYERALEILTEGKEEGTRYMFPYQLFLFHGLRALIFQHFKRQNIAKEEALKALRYVQMKKSGFRYHPHLGLVPPGYWLIKELKKLQ